MKEKHKLIIASQASGRMSRGEKDLAACIGVTSVCEYFTACKAQHLDTDRCYKDPIGCSAYSFYKRFGLEWIWGLI